jgi:hypothetical protein
MKKYIVLLSISLFAISFLSAQQKILIHNGTNVMYESPVSEIDSIKFQNASSVFNFTDGNTMNISISSIDSITFGIDSIIVSEHIVYIIYEDDSVIVINPLESQGVDVSISAFDVTISATSGIENIEYHISGSTENGSLSITSDKAILMTLSNLSLIRLSGTPITINDVTTTIQLSGTNTISDATDGKDATLYGKGDLIFTGSGKLTISGYKKHTISSDKTITIESGTFNIPQSANDGFHCEGFTMNGGFITVTLAQGDAIDAGSGFSTFNSGIINITSDVQDVKGIKSNGGLTINGGEITMDIAGAQSKGISTKGDLDINGGTINIITSGATVLEESGSGYDPSYCTAIKADGDISITAGTITIVSQSNADGGKGISADGNIIIHNGNITISTAGTGKTYTDENGAKDSYTSSCIKSDKNISLLGGMITCTSTGAGGKGISADGYLTIGIANAANEDFILNVTTSGERFYVSGSGDDADYANPKAVKCEDDMIINSGTITIRCTQSDEGGEGLESKDTMIINGGIIDITAYDDCINASNHILITGGNIHCTSSGNDAIDCNGTLTVSGGFIIANGAKQPEGGIDCDQSRFAVNGGILIGTGGSTSNPTANASSQYSIIYNNATAGNAICLKNSNNETILLFQLPALSGSSGGGGGPGGGGNSNSMTVLFSDPALTTGSYTLQYGGTISGGVTVNGYNTGGSYSGGSSKTFTIGNKVTTVN